MNAEELRALAEKISRTVKTTTTYIRNSELFLYHWAHVAPNRPMPTEFWTLVEQMLDTAYVIVERLPEDWWETTTERGYFDGEPFEWNHAEWTVGERLAKLNDLYETRRKGAKHGARIRALENTTGRTPEEAAAYRAKAAELRAKGATA